MGYTTEFTGQFEITPPLTLAQRSYLAKFCETRRMKRDPAKTRLRPDNVREDVMLPVGEDGGYFVGEDGFAGQAGGSDVVEHNDPPNGQPSLWCHWTPTEDGRHLEWSGMEKFYDYTEWLQYLCTHFLERWGCTLSGEVEWVGEDPSDLGKICCQGLDGSTLINVRRGRITYE